jgi:hypothetical protein
MNAKQIAEKLGCSENHVRKYKGQFRYHRSYFFHHGISPEKLENFVKTKIPNVVITDSGDHFHSFVGSAPSGSAKDSFMWVTFTVKEI